MTFKDFRDLYDEAYGLGCKGCTSYRYSEVRGSILSAEAEESKSEPMPVLLVRPEVLSGQTYKVRWPSSDESYYITINDVGDKPFEVFIQSTSSRFTDWTTALALMISAIMRKGGDLSFIPEELRKVRSAIDGGYVGGTHYGSLVAVIGDTIGKHLSKSDIQQSEDVAANDSDNPQVHIAISASVAAVAMDQCPQCYQLSLVMKEGCSQCTLCTYSRC